MDQRSFHIEEGPQIPGPSLLLGFGAMLPLALGALLAWVLPAPAWGLARTEALIWGGAILAFLAGVRRGLSFRTPNGPRWAQLVTMACLFMLAMAALATLPRLASPLLLLVGYLALAVLDPLAARRGEAPLFFARLRPVQMAIPVASLVALAVR